MDALTPIQQQEALELFHKRQALLASREKTRLMAVQSAPQAPQTMREIPCISLGESGSQAWKKNMLSSFQDSVSEISDVKPGMKGSIGICYGITESLAPILDNLGLEDGVARVKAKKFAYTCGARAGKPLHSLSIKYGVVPFYQFASQTENPYFVIKKGTKGLWLAKKTSAYSYESGRTDYRHRFSFEIIRSLTEEEGNLEDIPGNSQVVVRYKTIAVPV